MATANSAGTMQWLFAEQGLQGFALPQVQLAETAVALCRVQDHSADLTEAEREHLADMGAVRVKAFSSGRFCAAKAQSALNRTPQPVLMKGRVPVWPPGLRGSITHAKGVAAAIATSGPVHVGIDIENVGRVQQRMHRMIFTPAERTRFGQADPAMQTLVFSAKEAGYKAVHPIAGAYIGFQEAEIDIDAGNAQFRIRYLGEHVANRALERGVGYFVVHNEHVLSLFVIPAP